MKYVLAGFALLLFVSPAAASSECAQIEDSLERLSCYDSLYRANTRAVSEDSTTEDLFAEYKKLVEYRGPLGFRTVAIEDCTIFDQSFQYDTFEGKQVPSRGTLWHLIADLKLIDADKSGAAPNGYELVMERDANLAYSKFFANNYTFETGSRDLNWTPPPVPERSLWEDMAFSEATIRSTFPKMNTSSTFGGDSFDIKVQRSVTWGIHSFWKEDRDEIEEAFDAVVSSCAQ